MTTLPPPTQPIPPAAGRVDRIGAALWTNRSKKGKAGVIVGGLVVASLIAGPFLPAEGDESPVAAETTEAPEVTDAPAETTDAPEVTDAPAETTDAPEVSDAPVETTEAPVMVAATEAPTTVAAPTTSAAPVVTAPSLTIGQINAIGSAESYLDYTAFSRQGLIDQLIYEEFSVEDATFAVDFVNPDWLEQAAKSAQQYLDYSSFSRQSLIDQLIYEGFSPEQAEFGVVAVGY